MSRAGGQLAQRDEFLRLHDLRLEPLQILDGPFGLREQARAIGVGQIGPQEDKQSQGNGGEKNSQQAKIADCGIFVRKSQREDSKQRQRHYRGHGQTCRYNTLSAKALQLRVEIVFGRRVKGCALLVSNEARESKPKKRGNHRKIVQAACVVAVDLESDVDGKGG